jgi:hypothetical protein
MVEGVAVGAVMALRNGSGFLDYGISGSEEVVRWPWRGGAPARSYSRGTKGEGLRCSAMGKT